MAPVRAPRPLDAASVPDVLPGESPRGDAQALPSRGGPFPSTSPATPPTRRRRPDSPAPPTPGPGPLGRWLLGALVALLTVLALVAVLRLHTSTPVGVADNYDGSRLTCAAGLVPDTPEGTAAWRGVVVTAFRTDGPGCTDGTPPTSAAVLLEAAVALGGGPVWSLRWFGLLGAGLVGLGTGLGAVAASAGSRRRAAVVLLPLLPLLAVPWWSRFLVSTYFEPAGLIGALWLLTGAGAVAVTGPEHRWSRTAALGLVVAGGVLAGTAKTSYLPLAGAAAVLAVAIGLSPRDPGGDATRPRAWRAVGPLAGLAILGLVALPASAALGWQQHAYAATNTHNLVFTAILPTLGPGATGPLGLDPGAAAATGEGWYLHRGTDVPGWAATVGAHPEEVRAAAVRLLADRPGAAAAMVGRGLQATMRPQLPYLTSAARGSVPDFSEVPVLHRDSPLDSRILLAYLDEIPGSWLPAGVVVTALLTAALSTVPRVRRRAGPTATRLVRVAALVAVTGVALVTVAVLGDGYYELTKHVWLASYLLVEVALFGLAALVVGPGRRLATRIGPRGRRTSPV